jgi:Papain family cysteine protease
LNKKVAYIASAALLVLVIIIVYRAIKHPVSLKKRGIEMQKEVFKKVQVFQKLDTLVERLPLAVSLEEFCPTRMDQGDQNSCVGWSSAYAARTILEARASGKDPNSLTFSPAFLYNQIHLPDCVGSLMPDALRMLNDGGLLSFDEFPYDPTTCDHLPTAEQKKRAERYKITGFSRLTKSQTDVTIDTVAIKQCLAKGSPVLIGALVMESFENCDTTIWRMPEHDRFQGGHAMCVIGYNDTIGGGCFRIMNSWGEDWADNGFVWVPYNDFFKICREAYAIDPLPKKKDENTLHLALSVYDYTTNRPVGITENGLFFYKNKRKNDRAKRRATVRLVVKNELDCYLYILAQRKSRSIVLFPNSKEHHAPYLGLSGRRIFPSDKSKLTGKELRKYSYMTVITAKTPIDIDSLNKVLNGKKVAKLSPIARARLLLPDANPQFFTGSGMSIMDTLQPNQAVVRIVKLRK